jgi:hypothetical protein
MFSFGRTNIQWLGFLLAAITFAVLGVLFPNWFKQAANPRAHNSVKLLNECLARHQFAYFTFFVAIYLAAKFQPNRADVIKIFNWFAIALSFGFYGYGVFASALQDRKIAKHHNPCRPEENECEILLPLRFCFKLCAWNITFAIISLATGVIMALLILPAPP